MKKNKIWLMIAIIIIVLLFVFKIIYNQKRVLGYDSYMMRGCDSKVCHISIEKNGAAEVLQESLNGFYDWSLLPLSEHFKQKFGNRKNILKDIDNIDMLYAYKSFDEDVIVVDADKKFNLFDKNGRGIISTEYIFTYKVENGLLDDIELIDSYDEYTLSQARVDENN